MKLPGQWWTRTWNPITGCTPISEGCAHCYAKRMATRLAGRCGYPADDPFRVTSHGDKKYEPMQWKKPEDVFVCSMGDLFHKDAYPPMVEAVWHTMQHAGWHTFMILTKRADRMQRIVSQELVPIFGILPNVWLGVTAENQARANERIPHLLATPAAKRFVSCEPLLGPVDLTPWLSQLDWVIVGGETGPGARAVNADWVQALHDHCADEGVPYWLKQLGVCEGEWGPDLEERCRPE